jgi:hypothetical protein
LKAVAIDAVWDHRVGHDVGQIVGFGTAVVSSGDQLSSQSYFTKVLTKEVTKVINVPSLADSYLTGVNGGIVNMTLPNIDNWRRFAKSASAGDSRSAAGSFARAQHG